MFDKNSCIICFEGNDYPSYMIELPCCKQLIHNDCLVQANPHVIQNSYGSYELPEIITFDNLFQKCVHCRRVIDYFAIVSTHDTKSEEFSWLRLLSVSIKNFFYDNFRNLYCRVSYNSTDGLSYYVNRFLCCRSYYKISLYDKLTSQGGYALAFYFVQAYCEVSYDDFILRLTEISLPELDMYLNREVQDFLQFLLDKNKNYLTAFIDVTRTKDDIENYVKQGRKLIANFSAFDNSIIFQLLNNSFVNNSLLISEELEPIISALKRRPNAVDLFITLLIGHPGEKLIQALTLLNGGDAVRVIEKLTDDSLKYFLCTLLDSGQYLIGDGEHLIDIFATCLGINYQICFYLIKKSCIFLAKIWMVKVFLIGYNNILK